MGKDTNNWLWSSSKLTLCAFLIIIGLLIFITIARAGEPPAQPLDEQTTTVVVGGDDDEEESSTTTGPALNAGCPANQQRLGVPILTHNGIVYCVDGMDDYIAALYIFLIDLGVTAAIIMVVYGGVRYMSSQGNPEALEDAKERIVGALIGLALIVLAGLIIAYVNPIK